MTATTPAITHISYSALQSYFVSPRGFHKSYILRLPFENKMTSSAGKAWHKGLDHFYRGDKDYVKKALEYLKLEATNIPDIEEEYEDEEGNIKTKKVKAEDSEFLKEELKMLESNLLLYPTLNKKWEPLLEADQDTGELLPVIEKKVFLEAPIEGGLPIVGTMDILTADNGVADHKYVARFDGHPLEFYYIQAWFYYYLAKAVTGKHPDYFLISEFKKAPAKRKPKKGEEPECQLNEEKVLQYDEAWIKKIDKWYLEMCQVLTSQISFPANPFHPFDHSDWDEFLNS